MVRNQINYWCSPSRTAYNIFETYRQKCLKIMSIKFFSLHKSSLKKHIEELTAKDKSNKIRKKIISLTVQIYEYLVQIRSCGASFCSSFSFSIY